MTKYANDSQPDKQSDNFREALWEAEDNANDVVNNYNQQ